MKRKRSVLAAAILDIVAPLDQYSGEVSRCYLPGPTPEAEETMARLRSQRIVVAVQKMNRRKRRAFHSSRSGGATEEQALAAARAAR